MKLFLVILIPLQLVLFTVFLQGADQFKRIDQWKHDEIFGYDFFSFVDKDNHVVGGFRRIGCRIVTPDKIIKFAPRGQGPSDLSTFSTAFPYKNGDIAIVELPMKTKIFTKKNSTYVWKETKWLKQGPSVQIIKDGVFSNGKFFLTGMSRFVQCDSGYVVVLLKVFDESGKPLKQLIKREYSGTQQFNLMKYHISILSPEKVVWLPENELKLTVISSDKLEIVNEADLEIPSFYKPMPKEFYIFKKYDDPKDNFGLDVETWATGYSSITEVAVDGKFLVVQVRTCSDKLKKFALLFYNAENNFKLERTVFTDDFLLDVKNGKYYCFANGNPGRDDDTDECIINIYSWK